MSQVGKGLPNEATVIAKVDAEVENNGAIREFLAECTPYQAERLLQIMQHVGYVMFEDGLRRPADQQSLSIEHQGLVLAHETSLFLQGSGAFVDYLDE